MKKIIKLLNLLFQSRFKHLVNAKIIGEILNKRISQQWNLFLYLLSLFIKFRHIYHNPVSICISLTNDCNFDCKHCFQNRSHRKLRKHRNFTIEEIKKILDMKLFKDAFGIVFSGGEVLMNKELIKIIEYARHKKYYTMICTNGLLLKKYNDELLRVGLNAIQISMDILDKSSSYKVREVNEAVRSLISEAVAELSRKNIEYNNAKMEIIISYCLHSENYHHMENVILFALENKVNTIRFQNLNTYVMELKPPNHIRPLKENDVEYIKYKSYINAKYGRKINIVYPYLFKIVDSKLKKKCRDPFYTLIIDVNGQVVPCCFVAEDKNPECNIYENYDYKNSIGIQQELRKYLINEELSNKNCENCHLLYMSED